MRNERIYYVSNYDGLVHNINDVDHVIVNEKSADIGIFTDEGLRVDDEVNLWTIKEIAEFF